MPPAFTVFTPTYNRAHTLRRVFEGLQAQTCRDFEWLIVDDGSTDGTRDLVEFLAVEADFPVRYVHQENRGKHFAFNRGVAEAAGRLLVNLDSDDRALPNALERLLWLWDSLSSNEQRQFSSIVGLCVDQDGRVVGDRFPAELLDSDPLELRYRYRVGGEKWGFTRIEVLREFPFPEVLPGEYLPESIVWSRIARLYRTRYVNETFRVYHTDRPSMVHGRHPAESAAGGRLEHLTALNETLDYFGYSPGQFFRSAVHYGRFSFHSGVPLRRQWADLRGFSARLLWAAFLPVAWAVYLRERR